MATIFCSITYISLARAMRNDVDQRLTEEANAIAARLSPQFDGNLTFELSQDQIKRYRRKSVDASYFAIWNRNGEEVDRSGPKLSNERLDQKQPRTVNGTREVIVDGPDGSRVLVGKSLRREQSQLNQLVSTAIGVGTVMLLVSLVGGWILIRQALKPIDRISSAAAAISERNLSERIDVSSMETELSDLSCTLNDAFDRLEATFDRQARFSADASHELRTPLSVVLAQVELTLSRPRTEAEHVEALTIIRKAAGRMKSVVEDLLTLARADKNELILNKVDVDFKELVSEICTMMDPMTKEKRLVLETSFHHLTGEATVFADRERLADAVSNLVSNAVHFNVQNGTVNVSLSTVDNGVRLIVQDTGVGISKADQSRIFDRFYQVDEARQYASGRGSGLGLAITKWIIESHDGTLTVSSVEGIGTEFAVTLPLKLT